MMRPPARLCALLALAGQPAFAQAIDPTRTLPITTKAGMSEDVNVGQICDGASDVAPQIQAAAALAGPTRALHFPPQAGVCLLSSNIKVASGTKIRAEPGTVTLKPTPGNASDPLLLNLNSVSNVIVHGLRIDGGGSDFSTGANVVTVYNGSWVILDHVDVANTRGVGVIFSQSNNSGVRNSAFTNIGNRWKTTLSAADRKAAVVFCCGTTTQNIGNFANDNTFSSIGLDAVSATQTAGFVAARNNCAQRLRQWSLAPSFADYPACIFVHDSVDLTLSQNVSTDAHGNGLDIGNVTGFTIAGNYMLRSGAAGIAVDANDGTIFGNVSNDNGQSGKTEFCLSGVCAFAARAPLNGVSIAGNTTTDTQTTKTQRYGVEVKGNGCLNCNIPLSNTVAGNGVSSYGGLISTPKLLATKASGMSLMWGAWTAYMPALTASGGSGVSFADATAAYQQVGKTLSVRATFRVDYTEAGPTRLSLTLPNGQTSIASGQTGNGVNLSANISLSVTTNGATTLTVGGAGGVVVNASGQYVTVSFAGEMQ